MTTALSARVFSRRTVHCVACSRVKAMRSVVVIFQCKCDIFNGIFLDELPDNDTRHRGRTALTVFMDAYGSGRPVCQDIDATI
jgi:hypothetical protein